MSLDNVWVLTVSYDNFSGWGGVYSCARLTNLKYLIGLCLKDRNDIVVILSNTCVTNMYIITTWILIKGTLCDSTKSWFKSS